MVYILIQISCLIPAEDAVIVSLLHLSYTMCTSNCIDIFINSYVWLHILCLFADNSGSLSKPAVAV